MECSEVWDSLGMFLLCSGEPGLALSHMGWRWPFLCLACLQAMSSLCAPSPLPCLNPWLFWELLATT